MLKYETALALRQKGQTLLEIANKHNITKERVRQILHPKAKISYLEFQKQYKTQLPKLSDQQMQLEIRRLNKRGRKAIDTIQRIEVIRFLHTKKKMSFDSISKMLNKHHTTILHLYKKNEKHEKN